MIREYTVIGGIEGVVFKTVPCQVFLQSSKPMFSSSMATKIRTHNGGAFYEDVLLGSKISVLTS